MKRLSKILATLLALTFVISSVICASAAKYVAKVVFEDFEQTTNFLAPGDLDANGKIETNDYVVLRGLILNNETAKYSDVNGDINTNICDLVLQDINFKSDFVANGKMNLNGKSVYNPEIAFNTGVEYKVTYTASDNVNIKLVGLSGVEITESGYTFKTPLNLSRADVQLYVVGEGTVEDLAITRISMDNDYSVN